MMAGNKEEIVFVLPDGRIERRAYIRTLSGSCDYDGHWPLTEDERIAIFAELWLRENKSKYYATGFMNVRMESGASVGGTESDFIVLLSNFLKDMKGKY